ncbi:MAG: S1 RNA-binding domain-containing protein, partial [Eggerthellaceae bacterium]
VGTIVDSKVTKIVPFGAFIELGQSIEGLVHISEMAMRHIDTPAQVVKAGDEVKVKVMEINPERRRISLSLKATAADLGFEIEVDESIQVEETPAKKAEKADAPRGSRRSRLPNSLSVHNGREGRSQDRPSFAIGADDASAGSFLNADASMRR